MKKKLMNSSFAAFGMAALLLTGACATQGGGDPAMNPTVSAQARDASEADASENIAASGAPLSTDDATTTQTIMTTNTTAPSTTVDQSMTSSSSLSGNQSMTSSSSLDTQSTNTTSGTMTDNDTTTSTTATRTRMRKD